MTDPLLNLSATPAVATPCLALRPREAAAAIGVSERTLWAWTAADEVPHFRVGKAVLYPVDALRRWLDERASGAKEGGRR